MLARLFGVVFSVGAMAMRHVRMVPRLFVISGGVMRGCRAMMLRGVVVVIGRFQMVFFTFFRHDARFLRLRDLGFENTPKVRIGDYGLVKMG